MGSSFVKHAEAMTARSRPASALRQDLSRRFSLATALTLRFQKTVSVPSRKFLLGPRMLEPELKKLEKKISDRNTEFNATSTVGS